MARLVGAVPEEKAVRQEGLPPWVAAEAVEIDVFGGVARFGPAVQAVEE